MNPFKVPTGGQDPATHLINIGTLENPTWVSADSGNYRDWLATGSKARSESSVLTADVVTPDVTPLITLSVLGFGLYFLWKKFINRQVPTLIQIPESAITDAVEAVVLFRGRNEPDPDPRPIGWQIRSYIYLGTNKLIKDWSYKLTSTEKDSIVTQTINRIQDQYSFRPAYAWVYTNYDVIETLASTGDLQINVAQPRMSQELYEKQLVDAHANDQNPVLTGIQDFFGVSKTAIEAMLKGLGLNIPLETIIILAVVLAVVLLLRRSNA